jgi:general secretion pathway protein C
MLARLSAFVIWALVAATVVFWGLRLLVRAPAVPDRTVVVADATVARGDLSRLLGTAPVATSAAAPMADANSRFKLLGIMAPKDVPDAVSTHGVALIAVDGKMPKAYVVGSSVDGDLLLRSVSLRTVSIGSGQGGPAAITLELPPPVAAAIGKLPAGGATTSQVPFVPPPTAPPVAPVIVPQQVSPQPAQSLEGKPAPAFPPQQPGVPGQPQPQNQ